MKTIYIVIAALLCLATAPYSQAFSKIVVPGTPCPCCKVCEDKQCQEMCATVEQLHKEGKQQEASTLATQCEEHCKTVKCHMKKKKHKACCSNL